MGFLIASKQQPYYLKMQLVALEKPAEKQEEARFSKYPTEKILPAPLRPPSEAITQDT